MTARSNPTHDSPVVPAARLAYLDVLRGFAVLAIFIVNIKAMAMPLGWYWNPSLWVTEADQTIAIVQQYLVDNKWRTIFTALFGAGLVLIGQKFEARGGSGRLLLRLFWLLVFGLIHLICLWSGDILTPYALAGFLVFWLHRKPAKALGVWAGVMMVIALLWTGFMDAAPAFVPELAEELGPLFWGTDPATNDAAIATALSDPATQISSRLYEAFGYLVFYNLLGGHLFLTAAIMVTGMALFKAGWLAGRAPFWAYGLGLVVGLGGALAIEHLRSGALIADGWTYETFSLLQPVWTISGLLGAFGYSALIALLVRAGVWLKPFAAAGRMAFTNYIACTLIGTTLYGPWGMARFGDVTLAELIMVVGATSLAILIWSPLWLAHFRFGPLEWLWRSLTYLKLQPMRRA